MGILDKIKNFFGGNANATTSSTSDAGKSGINVDKIKEKAHDVMEDVGEFADKAATKVGETAEKVWDKVDDYVEPAIEKVEKKAEEVYDKVVDFFDGDKEVKTEEEKDKPLEDPNAPKPLDPPAGE